MRNTYGTTVYKVNVDGGFTCPNRDGTVGYSGCIYCNNDSFRPQSCKPTIPIREQIKTGISHVRRRYNAGGFIVYFQPYTNTYASVGTLERLYREALEDPLVQGLSIGTRPDAVDDEKLDMIAELGSRYFILIEYGLQSMYEKTLQFINRGHDYETFLKAVEMTRERGLHVGAHIIVGFPTETRAEMLRMADDLSVLPIEFLKIHQLQVVRHTPLEAIYNENPFFTFAYDEYVDFVTEFLEKLNPDIVIQRLFATAPDSILVAPQWGKNRQQILRDIEAALASKNTFQGKKFRIHSIQQ